MNILVKRLKYQIPLLRPKAAAGKFFYEYLPFIILTIAVALFIKFSIDLEFFRYEHFQVGKFDTGNMAQAVWNTSKGRFLNITDTYGTNFTRFGNSHIDLILVLFAPVFYFFPDPRVLLAAQIVVLGLGAVGIFLLADRLLRNKWASLLLSGAFLLHPAIQNLAISDFHGITLSAVFIIFTLYFLELEKIKLVWLFLILALLGREDVSLVVSLIGFYIWVVKKRRRLGLRIFSLGIAWFVISFFVIIPWHGDRRIESQNNFVESLGIENFDSTSGLGQNYFLEHIKSFGGSYQEVAKNIVFKPGIFIRKIFNEGNLKYLNQIASPLAYAPYLSPHVLFLTMPTLLINFLGEGSRYRSLIYHHSSIPTAIFFIASIFTVYWLGMIITGRTRGTKGKVILQLVLTSIIFLNSVSYAGSYSAPVYPHFKMLVQKRIEKHLPWIYEIELFPKEEVPGVEKIDPTVPVEDDQAPSVLLEREEEKREEIIDVEERDPNWMTLSFLDPRETNTVKEVLELIPPDVSVSVPNYMGSYTSLREGNALFPANFNSADFVVFDFFTPQFVRDLGNLHVNLIISDLLGKSLSNPDYTVVYSGGGLVVLEKNSSKNKPLLSIAEVVGESIEKDYIYFDKFGVRLRRPSIPNLFEVNKRYELEFDWLKEFKYPNKFYIITSFINTESGKVFQEIHIPSLSILPPEKWEHGKVYRERFELTLSNSLRSGEYEVVIGLLDTADIYITGYNLGRVQVVNDLLSE